MHFFKYRTFEDEVAFCSMKSKLLQFEALRILFTLYIEAKTKSKGVFANEIRYKIVKYINHNICIANIIRTFNI